MKRKERDNSGNLPRTDNYLACEEDWDNFTEENLQAIDADMEEIAKLLEADKREPKCPDG